MRTKTGLRPCSILVAVSLLAWSGTGLSAQEVTVTVRDAWVRVPAPSKDETALYLVIENHGAAPRRIVGASSDAAERLEMHEMKMEKMMMRMTQVAEIPVPAKGKTSLNPNGLHIMLYRFKSRPAVGDSVNVTLRLDDGTMLPVVAIVRK